MNAQEAEGMGQGSTDGSTRTVLVKEAEKQRSDALDKALLELPDQQQRAVLVRKNMDKLSTAFLLSRLTNGEMLSSMQHFQEATSPGAMTT